MTASPPSSSPLQPRLGVFGGTFDPIHIAHLIVARCALEHFGLRRVLFVPTGTPPHKQDTHLSPRECRLLMTRGAVADQPDFAVSDIETRRNAVSFTIDTVRALRQEYDDALYMIIGEDSLRDMQHWKSPEEILAECTVVVARRPLDTPAEDLPYSARVQTFPAPLIDVSSTMIRRRVMEGLSIRYLVPPAVETFIQESGLYRGEQR